MMQLIFSQSKDGLAMTYVPTNARKVDMADMDNLEVCLNINNYILERVIDSEANGQSCTMGF